MQLNKFQDGFGLERADVENWTSRGNLRTKYQDTVPGRAREFSRLNVIELAMMKALVSAGCKPSSAAAFAEVVVGNYKDGLHQKRWLILPSQNYVGLAEVEELTQDIANKFKNLSPCHAIVAIDAGAIVERVDQIFNEKGC